MQYRGNKIIEVSLRLSRGGAYFYCTDNQLLIKNLMSQTCQEVLDADIMTLGYVSKFDEGQGNLLILDGEVCWEEIVAGIESKDEMISSQIQTLEEAGFRPEEQGLPTFEQYVQMRDAVTDYTSGKILLTRWSWSRFVPVGESHGLCIGQNEETATGFWSCWEWSATGNKTSMDGMEGVAEYENGWKSYLIDPQMWTENSRLDDFEDLGMGAFPAMYGGWLCQDPQEMFEMFTSECFRFIPNSEYASMNDPTISTGPVKVMTYSTQRENTTRVEGNESLTTNLSEGVLEAWTVNLSESGAWSGISAVGFALASAVLLSF